MAKKPVAASSILVGIGSVLALGAGCQKQQAAAPESAPAAPAAAPAAAKSLTIWWAQWAPADGLQDLANEFGKQESVEVKVHQIPWASFQDQVFQEFGKNQTAFDIVVGDSQWLGRGATKGLYVDLTDWLPSAVPVKGLHPLALKYLAEYPTGSAHYFAAPAETDAMGWAYRKDWFDDPAEKAAFKKSTRRSSRSPRRGTICGPSPSSSRGRRRSSTATCSSPGAATTTSSWDSSRSFTRSVAPGATRRP